MRSKLIGLMLLTSVQWAAADVQPPEPSASSSGLDLSTLGGDPITKVDSLQCYVAGSGTPACNDALVIPVRVSNGKCWVIFPNKYVTVMGRSQLTADVKVVWTINGPSNFVFDPTNGVVISGGGSPSLLSGNWGSGNIVTGSSGRKFAITFKKAGVAVPIAQGFTFAATIYDKNDTSTPCSQVDPVIGNN